MPFATVEVVEKKIVVRVNGTELLAPLVTAATDAATAAAQSAAYAGGFEAPEFASQSAGNAATTAGQIFRVPLGTTPQTFNWYRRLSSGSELVDPLATNGALAATGGAELIGALGGETVQDMINGFATVAAMKAAPKASLIDGLRVTVRGFAAVGDGGGGDFIWNAASTAAAVTGFIVAADEGGAGRWVRQHYGTISDRMAGAKVDNVTDDTAALVAMAAIVTADTTINRIVFAPGQRKVLLTGGAATTPFDIASRNGLTFDFTGAIFNTTRTGAEPITNLFRFTDCPNITFIGRPKVTGTLTKAQIADASSAVGVIGFQFFGNCSNPNIDVEAEGCLEPVLFARTPKVKLDATKAPFIGAGGTGYTVGDVLTLANIGAAAEVNATLTVAAVDAGVITSLTVTNPGRFPFFGTAGVSAATAGFAVTGGTGTGALICPFTVEDDPSTISVGGRVKVKATICYYGFNAQWNLTDADVSVEADTIIRAYFVYGVRQRLTMLVRNQRQRSFISAYQGLSADIRGTVTILPPTEAAFGIGTQIVVAGYGATANRAKVDLDIFADYGGNVDAGQLFAIEKYTNGGNDASPRGHEIDVSLGGKINGRGTQDSGLAANIVGTNVNYLDAAWVGDKLRILLKDGLTVTGVASDWGFAFNANALERLVIGKVNLSCSIKTDPLQNGIFLAPRGRIIVDRDAVFANRYANVLGFFGIGQTGVSADFAVSANLAGSHFDHIGGGITIVGTLPPAIAGLEFSFSNSRSLSGEFHLAPAGSAQIGDGATYGAPGKKLRLTGLGSSVTLRCYTAGLWHVERVQGTWSFEP